MPFSTIQCPNFTEKDEISCEWNIPEFEDGYSYRSPDLGWMGKELSDCYLEMRPNLFLNGNAGIFLCSSEELIGYKITFTAGIKEGIHPLPNMYSSEFWIDLKKTVKVFEIVMRYFNRTPRCFTFRLDIKLKRDVNQTSSSSNKKISNRISEIKSKYKLNCTKPNIDSRIQTSKAIDYQPSSVTNTPDGTKNLKDSTQDKRSLFTFDSEEKAKANRYQSSSVNPNQQGKDELENAQHLVYPKELIQNFRSLYTSELMCDLEIRIGEKQLRAHKLILSARSPVFKAMLEHDCLETSSNCILIDDCLASSFDKFLKYIYTGEIEDRTIDTVMTLYSLSDKYDVPSLREACFKIMQNELSSKSVDDVADIVCNVLQLADCHSDSKLKDLAASFISNHFALVSKKQNWKDLMKSNVELASEILALVVTVCQKT